MENEENKEVTAEDIMLNAFRGETDPVKPAEEVEEVEEQEEEQEEVVEDVLDDDEEVVEEVVEDEEEVQEEEVLDDLDLDGWDENEEVEVEKPSVSYKDIATELGFGDLETKEDLVKAIKEKEESTAKEKVGKEFDGLPDELLDAIKLVKNGGDYREYLNVTAIDYKKIDAKKFFIEAAKEHFIKDDGTLDSESLQDFVDDQDETMMDIQGAAIKKQYVERQETEKRLLASNALKRKELTEMKLNDVLSNFSSFNGYKVNESHKKRLYQDITTGKAMKEMFYDKNGEYDMSKVVKAYFYYLKGGQMEKFRAQRAKNTALRDVLGDANNADLKVNGRKVTSNSKVDRKDPFDFLADKYGMKTN